jgi:hypothetical protein
MGKKKNSVAWVSVELGIGISSLIALIRAASGIPKWSVVALVLLGGLAFSKAALDLGWLRAPFTVGTPIRAGLILFPLWAAMVALGVAVWPRVSVTPARAAFNAAVPNENYTFIVRNRTDEDTYSIESVFKFDSGDHFSFGIPVASQRPIIDGSKLADIRALECVDSGGKPLLLVSIYHLSPRESREFSFTHKTQTTTIVTASVTYFTDVPQPRIDDPRKMRETFHAPGEPISCHGSFSFWLDPSRPPRSIDVDVERNPGNAD